MKLKMFQKHKDSLTSSEGSRSSTSSSASASLLGSLSTLSTQTSLQSEFSIVKTLAEGRFAKLLLAKNGHEKIVFKIMRSDLTSEEDFLREVHTNYFLSPHPNVITSFNVSFLWDNSYVFVQEFAPFGDLSRFIKKGPLPVPHVKSLAQQLSNAIQFLHSFNLVHSNLNLENILVFKSDLSLIKLSDFGSTRTERTLLRKSSSSYVAFSPPEVCCVVKQETYRASKATDVWQMGILLHLTLTGSTPWRVADITDARFCAYTDWLRKRSFRLPEAFKSFSPRLIRLLKRMLEPKQNHRCEIREVSKYLGDDWLMHGSSAKINLLGRFNSNSRNVKNSSRHKLEFLQKNLSDGKCLGVEEKSIDKTWISTKVENWLQTRVSTKSC